MNNFHMKQSDYNFKEMTDEQVVVIAQQEQNEFAIDYIVNIKILCALRRVPIFL